MVCNLSECEEDNPVEPIYSFHPSRIAWSAIKRLSPFSNLYLVLKVFMENKKQDLGKLQPKNLEQTNE
jgi:hypothetical protein